MAGLGWAAPALAAANNTYVSRNGVDSGTTCAVTTPCRTLQYAHNQTNPGGTIRVLDMGEYGSVFINKSITIRAKPGEGNLSGSTTSGDTVSISAAATDKVVLEGLSIDGNGGPGYGIYIYAAKSVHVIDCTVNDHVNRGIIVDSTATNVRTFIQRSNILRNGVGLGVYSSTGVMSVLDSLIDSNAVIGAEVSNSAILGMARSVINASPTSISVSSGGAAISIGPSNIISGTGGFTSTLPFN